MNRGSILLRVDASGEIGFGRLARCMALANALQRRRYQMTFVGQIEGNTWPDRIRRFRHSITKSTHAAGSPADLADMMLQIDRRRPKVVIVDHDSVGEQYLSILRDRVPLLVAMTDHAGPEFPVDLLINPMLGYMSKEFQLRPGTQFSGGYRYAMIRSEFRRSRSIRGTEPGGPARVLLALGGGEVAEQTLQYAKTLLKSDQIERVDAVVGISQECKEELQELVRESSGRFHVAGDVRDMGSRMSKTHVLITGGGNTALEAACVGVPQMVIARNQRQEANATWLEEHGVCQYLGPQDKVTAAQVRQVAEEILGDTFERKAMSRSGRMLIDGRGPDRLVTATEVLLRRSREHKVSAMPAAAAA